MARVINQNWEATEIIYKVQIMLLVIYGLGSEHTHTYPRIKVTSRNQAHTGPGVKFLEKASLLSLLCYQILHVHVRIYTHLHAWQPVMLGVHNVTYGKLFIYLHTYIHTCIHNILRTYAHTYIHIYIPACKGIIPYLVISKNTTQSLRISIVASYIIALFNEHIISENVFTTDRNKSHMTIYIIILGGIS